MITKEEVLDAQNKWGEGIVKIATLYREGKDYKAAAEEFAESKYGFEDREVLFKPTKAAIIPFRHDTEGAVSYFVGGNEKYPEDLGFAIQPIVNVEFRNVGMVLKGQEAISMGHYLFTDTSGLETLVEYTMCFYRAQDRSLKLFLHHSSFPFVQQ